MNILDSRWSMLVLVFAAVLAFSGIAAGVIAGFLLALGWSWHTHRAALRKLANPRFWGFSISITLLAGLLLGENPEPYFGIPVSLDGLLAGARMTMRAFTLVLTVSLLARFLPRQRVIRASSRLGIPHLDPAFQQAFSAMPHAGENLRRTIQQKGHRLDALAKLLVEIADTAQMTQRPLPTIHAVTGRQGAGKTSTLEACAEEASTRGFSVAGMLQRKEVAGDGKRTLLYAHRIGAKDRVCLAEGTVGVGFQFSEEAFQKVFEWVLEDAANADLIVLDELGRLESEGQGHAPLLQKLFQEYSEQDPVYLVSLRKDKLAPLQQLFMIPSERIVRLDRQDSVQSKVLDGVMDQLMRGRE